MCCSRHARAQVRALAATKTGGLGPFAQPLAGAPFSFNHPLPQPFPEDKKPAPAVGSDLNPLLQSAAQWFRKLAVANGRCAERQWRLDAKRKIMSEWSRSPTGDGPKGNGDSTILSYDSTQVSLVANGRCAERQWRLIASIMFRPSYLASPTGDAPKGNGDNKAVHL